MWWNVRQWKVYNCIFRIKLKHLIKLLSDIFFILKHSYIIFVNFDSSIEILIKETWQKQLSFLWIGILFQTRQDEDREQMIAKDLFIYMTSISIQERDFMPHMMLQFNHLKHQITLRVWSIWLKRSDDF